MCSLIASVATVGNPRCDVTRAVPALAKNMADEMESQPNGEEERRAKFAIADEDLDKCGDKTVETKQPDVAPTKNPSRFKVNRVDFINEGKNTDDEAGAVSSPSAVQPVSASSAPAAEDKGNVAAKAKPRQKQDSVCSDTASPPWSPNPTDSYPCSYDTNNLKTFGHNTLETLPHVDHYRNLLSATGAMKKRPTLLELHEHDREKEETAAGDYLLQDAENGQANQRTPTVTVDEGKPPPSSAPKFGWVKGVLVRCLLNIYGVMLFLRLSWMVGQAGIGLSALIILLSAVVTTITALSMSAICTNGQVKGGGAYFMISRSLGPEFGGAIGLVFSMANAVAVAMYVVGFAETIRDILKDHDCLMVDEINDVRIIGLLTVSVLLGVALVGMEWEARAQLGLLALLLIAVANFMIGTFISPSGTEEDQGFVGYEGEVFKDNWGPDFRGGESFFSVFAIFFPAATGILAGANISGDLADASSAIPKGTLLAILLSTITYIAMGWMAGSCVLRDAMGAVISSVLPGLGENTTMGVFATGLMPTAAAAAESSDNISDVVCPPEGCAYGLQNDMQVMQLVSAFGPLTIAGIISATLSSALASLVSAPKVFQAVCKDRIFPGIHVFAKGYGSTEEPRRAYLLAYGIGVACICIGQLNVIAPLISNFFLMSYALINYSCFDASLAKSPGWRPAFRYYSMWLSLLGAVLCLGVMFVINWWTALLTFAVVCALYVYVHYSKPDINWGSSTQAHVYRSALQHTQKLASVLEHVKNFRPQVLVLSGYPSDRPALVDIASNITRNISLMVCGHIVLGDPVEKMKDTRTLSRMAYTWLNKRKVKAFYNAVHAPSLRLGTQALLQCVGVGKMRPNTLILGFKSNWHSSEPQEIVDYFHIIHDAFDLHYGVGVLRLPEGLDCSSYCQELMQAMEEAFKLEQCLPCEVPFTDPKPGVSCMFGRGHKSHESTPLTGAGDPADTTAVNQSEDEGEEAEPDMQTKAEVCVKGHVDSINKGVLKSINRFQRKQKKGTIDVWWLFDDGGLTLLIPYILTTKSCWGNCKLRVFMAGTKKMELDRDQRHMATLLSKFRIEYSSMTVVPDIGKKPQEENVKRFHELVKCKNWMLDQAAGETEESHPWKTSETELSTQKDKTNRHIRLRELLQQYSGDASLIVMTLPMPKRGLCSSALYMAWLDTLTRDTPPILLLRGNQDSVLTYYS